MFEEVGCGWISKFPPLRGWRLVRFVMRVTEGKMILI
jgi:hypothetical protein